MLAAMNHLNDISYKNLNDISYKSPDVDVGFGFIKNLAAFNIDNETIKDFLVQLLEEKIIVNGKFQNGKDSNWRLFFNLLVNSEKVPNN